MSYLDITPGIIASVCGSFCRGRLQTHRDPRAGSGEYLEVVLWDGLEVKIRPHESSAGG